ncbi:MAG: 3-oxoacyl-ACP reductase FabG [Chloroflexota bacterium]|nr:3-oxoacyl-ACP reductase FabG [Chloroflexota bacterium]MDE2908756.1 3-oxoacyl-ACP reductase FabG [Chloroflexota bacterium]
MYDLRGKVALVTGAAGAEGIGRAIALRLAEEGVDLVVNDLREEAGFRSGLPETADAIEALGQRALAVYADVTDADQVERMVAQALGQFGRIDILINNAGAPAGRDRVPVVELEEEAFDLVHRVNVKGVFLCCRAVARHMLARGGGGTIINISSMAGKQGMPRYAAYCASKFAVRGFTQSLARELGPEGITVYAICPGLIASERIDDMAAVLAPPGVDPADHREEMITQSIQKSALGRMTQQADIAKVAAYLASDQSDFMTGASVSVDGGSLMD